MKAVREQEDNLIVLRLVEKPNKKCFGGSQTVCYLALEWTKETIDAKNPIRQRMNLAILAKTYPTLTYSVEGGVGGTSTSHEESGANEELQLTSGEASDLDASSTIEFLLTMGEANHLGAARLTEADDFKELSFIFFAFAASNFRYRIEHLVFVSSYFFNLRPSLQN
ncbi:hypothetical protein TSMEX_009875 [Taenia solium]|eukprot:TsM_001065300 transcript=TsM_001065300 gene=TsM_001065300